MENRKIKNSTPKVYNDIHFKSLLEVMVYKTLIQEGFNPEYEKHTYTIWEGFIPTIPFYTKNKFKRKNHNIEVLSANTVRDSRGIDSITYTPDFYFEYNNKVIIVECKGFENNVFPYKFKMFRYYIQECSKIDNKNYEIWEIFTKRQLLDCIKRLKDEES